MSLRAGKDGERGQVFVLTAFVLVVAIAAAGLAIDVGLMMHTRTEIQKDADAMALAGAYALCGLADCEGQADTDARDWGVQNNVTLSDYVVIQFGTDCDGGTSSSYDLITVRLRRHQDAFFARVIGYEGTEVTACASARKFALGGLTGVRPFGLEDTCINEVEYGDSVVLKSDSDTTRNCDSFQGNYGAITVGGSGADEYRDTIMNGSTSAICAEGVSGCTNYTFATQTGNMVGPSKQGLDYLFSSTPTTCDTWDEVMTDNGRIEAACNPWRPGFTGASRLIVVPVVDGMWESGGSNTIHVKRFAIIFLEGYSGNCTGNSCDIQGRFVKSVMTVPGGMRTALTVNADTTAVALVK